MPKTGSELSKTSILIALVLVIAITVLGSVFSPTNAIQIIGFGALTTASLFTLLRMEKTSDRVEQVAVKAEEVKQTLLDSNLETKKSLASQGHAIATQGTLLTEVKVTGERTEKYCNSAMGRALRLTATTARAKADITKDPVDLVAADLAEKELGDHEGKQADIDKHDGLTPNGHQVNERP